MRLDLLDLICCPKCHSRLLPAEQDGTPEIERGTLECSRCGSRYPVESGMPLLYVPDERWQVKEREGQGWLAMSKEDGAYDSILEIDYSFVLPYYPSGTWITVAPYFEAAMAEMALTGSETILDLGAGQGWASKYFAVKGCRAVAIDILPDERIGLGRARAVMERAGVYFERVIGDCENLPLRDGTFDIVFCCSSLHHSKDMQRTLKDVSRVLKKGGRFIASEPIIAITQRERDIQRNIREVSYGIVESRRNLLQLWWYLRRAGLDDVSIDNLNTLNVDDAALYRWIEDRLREAETQGNRAYRVIKMAVRRFLLRMPRRYAPLATFLLAGGDIMIQARKSHAR